jgi:N-acetylglucosaminyl-diphospho-decaprenol L-rhamnosyltransferase
MVESEKGPAAVVVVTYQSASVLLACIEALAHAAPAHGLDIWVADNNSSDGSADLAEERLGRAHVLRLSSNHGFAAGVNAGLSASRAPWIAVLNPDTLVPAGAIDDLIDVMIEHPKAGLVAPLVRDGKGRIESTIGHFPSVAGERAHAFMLDRLLGLEGRHMPFPSRTAPVEWVSGCAWLLRAAAVERVGPLDERYFMYYEDVDYCRRMKDLGWDVLATPNVEFMHSIGGGSSETPRIPADGGTALLQYFAKFHPEIPPSRVRAPLVLGWRLRRLWRRTRAQLGDRRSERAAARYALAIASVGRS